MSSILVETENGRQLATVLKFEGAETIPIKDGGVLIRLRPQLGKETPIRIARVAGRCGDSKEAAPINHQHDVKIGKPLPLGMKCIEGDSSSLSAANHEHAHGQINSSNAHQLASERTHGFLSKGLFKKLMQLPEAASLMFQRITFNGRRAANNKTFDLTAGPGVELKDQSHRGVTSVRVGLDAASAVESREVAFVGTDIQGNFKSGVELSASLVMGSYLVYFNTVYALTEVQNRVLECRLWLKETNKTIDYHQTTLGLLGKADVLPKSGSTENKVVEDWRGTVPLKIEEDGEYTLCLQYSVVQGLSAGVKDIVARARGQSLSVLRIS